MLNLNCVICTEIFSSSDDVHVTPCGHMFHNLCLTQWFQRSKTCPQCRRKCLAKSVHKVYFNLANLDLSRIDAGCLQSQLDDMTLKLRCTEETVEKSNTEIVHLKNMLKKCKSVVVGLEKKLGEKNSVINGQDAMLRTMRAENKVIDDQRKEIENLKEQMELVGSVNTVINSKLADVEKLVKENSNSNLLATLVVALKRELLVSENKRTDLRNALASAQYDFRKEREAKKQLEDKISSLESENYRLNNMVEKASPSSTGILENLNSKIEKTNLNANVENDSPLSINKRVKLIQESTSPYLNIKSSSIGLHHLMLAKDKSKKSAEASSNLNKNIQTVKMSEASLKKSSSDLSNKYSIFKKPRICVSSQGVKPLNHLAFNGYGGVEKKLDPIRKVPLLNTKPSSSLYCKKKKFNEGFNMD